MLTAREADDLLAQVPEASSVIQVACPPYHGESTCLDSGTRPVVGWEMLKRQVDDVKDGERVLGIRVGDRNEYGLWTVTVWVGEK